MGFKARIKRTCDFCGRKRLTKFLRRYPSIDPVGWTCDDEDQCKRWIEDNR